MNDWMALFVIISPHVVSNGWIVVMFVRIINLTGIKFEFFTNILQDMYDKRHICYHKIFVSIRLVTQWNRQRKKVKKHKVHKLLHINFKQ
jgi:hypothetical protein